MQARRHRIFFWTLMTGFMLTLGVTHHSTLSAAPFGPAFQPPADYEEFAIFIINGEWDLAAPNPEIPNCEFTGGLCRTDHYFTEVAGMSQAEIDAEGENAKAWFLRRFGIDVDDPANVGRLDFFPFTADSRANFRAHYLTGRKVPPEGYPIRDGAFGVMITDPDGFTLGGDFPGRHVVQNSFAVFGVYDILITNPAGNPVDRELFYYRSDTIIEPFNPSGPPDGIAAVSCQISDIPFDEGVENIGFVRMILEINLTEDGIYQMASRHTLTIGGRGPRLF